MSFTHLHVHSHYSLLKCSSPIGQILNRVSSLGMDSVALTDYTNMYGAVEFYFAAKKAGIKPIIGLEVFLDGDFVSSRDDQYSLVLLARDFQGYQSLCKISTYIQRSKEKFGFQRVSLEKLSQLNEGVFALTGGFKGVLAESFQKKGEGQAEDLLKRLQDIFRDNLYLELNKQGLSYEIDFIPFCMKVSESLGIPYVLGNDARFAERDDLVAHNVLLGIGSNQTLAEVESSSPINSEFYIKSGEEVQSLFPDEISGRALENMESLVSQCNVEFRLTDKDGKPIYHLPSFPTKDGRTSKEEIRVIALEGLERRMQALEKAQNQKFSQEQKTEYHERLDYELGVIDSMGFNGYFLIVQDFIRWTKDNDIPVGPGRGSGAGSLVAYSLEITDLDPMSNGLIFERFLNPERVSMPDFDIDFCQDRRGEVIDYVTGAYGEESVSQIITYGKLQTRAALRDVARVLGFSFQEVNEIVKLIPDVLGITLGEALDTEPRLGEMREENPQVDKLISLALKVEGLVRHAGIHAAGVIIADGDIVNHAPLTLGADNENVVQYDMKNSEKIGLIKFDFLGLKTLTHIKKAVDFLKKTKDKKIVPSEISLEDPGIYELMSRGDTDGVFQFEGEGITDLAIKAKPSCFADIVALNALYRPGPMEMIPEYLSRKSGKVKAKYIFSELEDILNETYGIIVYQEHVQLIASKIASYSLGEADMLRRAMGKKIPEEMAKQKTRFLSGAKDNEFDPKKSAELFELMAEFAKYGFNKSHAAAYCVITAQTAWLKNYYPVEFFTALLSTEISNTDSVVKYIADAKRHNIEIVPPHVNHSQFEFDTDGEKIFFSLGAIKGLGRSVVEAIVEARSKADDQKFESVEQFFTLVDSTKINKKGMESLIKSGSLDGLGYNRNELFSSAHIFLDSAEKKRRDLEVGQFNLFESLEDSGEEVIPIPRKKDWSKRAKLQLEKEALGFYLTSHPLEGYGSLRSSLNSSFIRSLNEDDHKKKVTVFGIIPKTKEFITKKGTRMAFGRVDDEEGSLELVIFPDVFAKVEEILTEEKPLLISGTYESIEGKEGKILVETIEDPLLKLKKAKKVVLRLADPKALEIEDFMAYTRSKSGKTQLFMDLAVSDLNKVVNIQVLDPEGVEFDFEFLDSVAKIFPGYRGLDIGV